MNKNNYIWFFVLSMFFLVLFLNISNVNALIANKEENSSPYVFSCGKRIIFDDATEPGRISEDGEEMIERKYQSLFEGEQIKWDVLAVDLDGIADIYIDPNNMEQHHALVFGTVGENPGIGNEIEVDCREKLSNDEYEPEECNAIIENYELTEFNPEIMKYFECILTIETPESMYGKNYISIEAHDKAGNIGKAKEDELYFLNPVIGINVNDSIIFDNLYSGEASYSNELLISNGADVGSGVILDMFITGTNFYSSNENDYCPDKQVLYIDQFSYFAKKGEHTTLEDLEIDRVGGIQRKKDNEGYVNMEYGVGFNNPIPFYNNAEIIQGDKDGEYYLANELGPNDTINIKFKIDVPKMCKGIFESGEIYFWGEAI